MDGVNDVDVVMEGVIDIVFVLEVEPRSFTTPAMEVTTVWIPGELYRTPTHSQDYSDQALGPVKGTSRHAHCHSTSTDLVYSSPQPAR